MNKKICLGIIVLSGILLIIGCVQKNVQSERVQLSNELNLSDFPEAFSENTYIVVGDATSQHEMDIAEKISSYTEKNTGQKLEIKESSAINKKDRNEYNFILIGQTDPIDNNMIIDIYEKHNTKSIRTLEIEGTNSYGQGTAKGHILLFKNLWSNDDRYILVIIGFDEKGLDFAVDVLLNHTYIKSVDDVGLYMGRYPKDFIQSSSYLTKRVASNIASEYITHHCQTYPEGVLSVEFISETENSYLFDGCGKIYINKDTGKIKEVN